MHQMKWWISAWCLTPVGLINFLFIFFLVVQNSLLLSKKNHYFPFRALTRLLWGEGWQVTHFGKNNIYFLINFLTMGEEECLWSRGNHLDSCEHSATVLQSQRSQSMSLLSLGHAPVYKVRKFCRHSRISDLRMTLRVCWNLLCRKYLHKYSGWWFKCCFLYRGNILCLLVFLNLCPILFL